METLGKEANRNCYTDLVIEEIPSDFVECYEIDEYDGKESIDLSSHLLVDYKLKNININRMSNEECKEFLIELQNISSTSYYEFMIEK